MSPPPLDVEKVLRDFSGEVPLFPLPSLVLFPDTIVPRDFDLVEVPFRERGTPQLVKGGAFHQPPEAVSSGAE